MCFVNVSALHSHDLFLCLPTLFRPVLLAVVAGGVIGSLVVYEVLQEKMSCEYGGQRFSSSVFLVFLMDRIVALVFAVITAILHGESLRYVAPLWRYVGRVGVQRLRQCLPVRNAEVRELSCPNLGKELQDDVRHGLGHGR